MGAENPAMQPNPLQLLGALVAVGVVLVLMRYEEQGLRWRYSLLTLLIMITVAAISLGSISTVVRLELVSLNAITAAAMSHGTMFAFLSIVAAFTIIFAQWLNRGH
jgi:hypothetical protein